MNVIGQAQKIIPMFLEILLTKKVFTWRAAKKSINLIEFFKQSLHLKNCYNSTAFIEKQRALLLLFEGKKRKLVRINLLVRIFLFVCFFKTNNIYSHTHSMYADG